MWGRRNTSVLIFSVIVSTLGLLISIALFIHIVYNPTTLPDKDFLPNETILTEKINSVNARISDIYIWYGFFVVLMVGGFALNWSNAKHTAREQAREQAQAEIEVLKKRYLEDLENLNGLRLQSEQNMAIITAFVQNLPRNEGGTK